MRLLDHVDPVTGRAVGCEEMTLSESAGRGAPDPSCDPDRAAVERVVAGEPGEYARLIERHQQGLMRLVTGITADRHVAEDVVQEVFLAAYRRLPGFRFESSFKTWLYRIAVRRAARAGRRLRRLWRTFVPLPEASAAPRAPAAARLDDLDEALALLARLRGPERAAFVLCAEGWSYGEIAEITGCASGTVAARISRARRRLEGLSGGAGRPARKAGREGAP
ncbi:MAG: RNA polymerase sigma factor [Planctomycetes bacterium]|nr:RNA polymerase sigma factor [Planctomycetota bacterium]